MFASLHFRRIFKCPFLATVSGRAILSIAARILGGEVLRCARHEVKQPAKSGNRFQPANRRT
jgi:hypothetical protein